MDLNLKLKKLKLIIFDIDGTLLTDNATIGVETKKLICKLKEHQVNFSFASGRLHSALTGIAEELKIYTPIVSLDGCLIKSYPDGNIIFESFVKEKYVKKVLYYADYYLIYSALCHAEAIYFTEENSAIPALMEKFGAKYQEVESYENHLTKTLEIVLAGDNPAAMKYIRDRLSFPYSFGLNTSLFKSHTRDGIFYLEIRKKGSTKGKGFLRLLNHLNLSEEDAAVMGDWYNDISLFKTKALKVALSNAVPEIKKRADIITKKNNNEDGTAEFLEMVLKIKSGNNFGRKSFTS